MATSETNWIMKVIIFVATHRTYKEIGPLRRLYRHFDYFIRIYELFRSSRKHLDRGEFVNCFFTRFHRMSQRSIDGNTIYGYDFPIIQQ